MSKQLTKLKNRGTGAGGSNTNKNGLSFEKLTNLDDRITVLKTGKFGREIIFDKNNKKPFLQTEKARFFKCMENDIDKNVPKAHGCKQPDGCYIDRESKNIFFIEKKSQQVNGSACEKIQTTGFKLWQYKRTIPTYNIVYIYCLSDWFKENCIAEIEYLDYKKIPYFWGNSETYKDDIINFIINYK